MGAAGGQKEAASAANHSQSRFSIRTGGQTRAEQVIVRGALKFFPVKNGLRLAPKRFVVTF
jgi:hypothetical protein